jgi:hypothetical protein
MKMAGLSDIVSCILVEVHRRFEGAYCLYQYTDIGGSTKFWNVVLIQDYTAIYPRKLSSSTKSVAPEPAGSWPYLQQPATGPYPQPVDPLYTPPANLPKINSDFILPSTPWPSKWFLSLWLPHRNLAHFPVLYHACHMPRTPHSPSFDLPNNIWGWVRNMKLLIVQLPPFSCYFIPLCSKEHEIALLSQVLVFC